MRASERSKNLGNMFGKLSVALEELRLSSCRPIGLATFAVRYFSKWWFLSTQLILSLWFQLPFLLSVLCTEPWAAVGSHWLKNGMVSCHFFWNSPIKITLPALSQNTSSHYLYPVLVSWQGFTSAYSYPSSLWSGPFKGSLQPIPTQATPVNNSQTNILFVLPWLWRSFTSLPNSKALMLSPEIACYQVRLSPNISEHSPSAHKPPPFPLPECHTRKHWLGDELTVQWHDDQCPCSSAGQL